MLYFLPYPTSYIKSFYKKQLLYQWQLRWSFSDKGRCTYNFFPNISNKNLISNRYLFLFLTNHGPFQIHLFQIDKRNSPKCVCDSVFTSLHYILDCETTSSVHVQKHPNQSFRIGSIIFWSVSR